MKEPVIEYILKAKSVKKILLCPGQYVLGTFLNKALWFLLLLNQLLSQAAGGIYLSLRPAFPWNIKEKIVQSHYMQRGVDTHFLTFFWKSHF